MRGDRSLAADREKGRGLSHLRLCARRGRRRDQRRPHGFLASGERLLSLPRGAYAGGDWYYGSGFTDGSSEAPANLEGHNTFDLSLGKTVAENVTVSVTALNLANRRFLLDNSQTFGGTHYAEPRQIYVQIKYRFHF